MEQNLVVSHYFCSQIFIQSTLVIVDSSVGGKMSTITSNSTITGEIHTKIDNRSAKSVHYTGGPRIARFLGERKNRVMRNRVMRVLF